VSEDSSDNFSMVLWQLQQYQHIIRRWDRHLDAYQFKAVMQILDRTIGWQHEKATFRPHVMLNGDRMYSGFGRSMSRSKLMDALSELEARGVISREPDPYRPGLKMYSINLDWEPDDAIGNRFDQRRARGGDTLPGENTVPMMDTSVSDSDSDGREMDDDVFSTDPLETYQDNTIVEDYHENIIGVEPSPTAPAQRMIEPAKEEEKTHLGEGCDAPSSSTVNPRARRRPPSH
jgi:hypothetical protein